MKPPHLGQLLVDSARSFPERIAVEDDRGGSITYAELDRLADRLATRLARWGVGRGDRVGVVLPKGIEAVASIHGILRAGAAYVPADAGGPPSRAATILRDAAVKAAIVDPKLAPSIRDSWPGGGLRPRLLVVGEAPTADPDAADWAEVQADDAPSPLAPVVRADDPAYILYTSGSTGVPKGVALSHRNAFAFLDWCESELKLRDGDRFASHAPFHFDLSIFDLYAPVRRGSTLVLVGESLGKEPTRLGAFISDHQIDVWYSAPSILSLLSEYGKLDAPGSRPPRVVLFAGEVFPIPHLRRLRSLWPDADFWNLYGPTETNVCTAFAIPPTIPDDRLAPFPIGGACPPARLRVVDPDGRDVPPGSEGELLVAGPGVTRGYFGRPDLTADAFLLADGVRWYRTGDLVVDDGSGCLTFRGRRDRMVKRRGHRIELGEIESALHRHCDVDRAAVVARPSPESGVSIAAFVALKPGRKGSIIAIKRHCAHHLPSSMIPDSVAFLPALPSTSTDKVDYRLLASLAGGIDP